MSKGYSQSRAAFWGVMGAGVLLSVLVWIRDRNYPIYIPIIASVLALGIGYYAARVVRNLVTNSLTTKYLGYLHMDLDPDKFIDTFTPVVGRIDPGTPDHAVASAYLSDGYAARGDHAGALTVLENGFKNVDLSDTALHGLYLGNKGMFESGAGDAAGAQSTAIALRALIEGCWRSKNTLARNLNDSLLLLNGDIALKKGELPDKKALEELYARCAYHLRRFEIDRQLALRALAVGDKKEAEKHLKLLAENGGKTFYTAWAQTMLSRSDRS